MDDLSSQLIADSCNLNKFDVDSDKCFVEGLGLTIDDTDLTPEHLLRVRQVLGKWQHVFSTGANAIGKVTSVKHKIVLTDETSFKMPYRKISPSMYEEVRQHLKDMIASDVIRPSDSPFSSNIVLVRKKDGSLCFCVDYRMLNSRTRNDATLYMLLRFDDTLDALSSARFFSKLDLKSAYWQVEMHEPDIEKTAFSVGNLGHWEFSRMSFGLCNAPSTFQRLSELCLSGLNLRDCLCFWMTFWCFLGPLTST